MVPCRMIFRCYVVQPSIVQFFLMFWPTSTRFLLGPFERGMHLREAKKNTLLLGANRAGCEPWLSACMHWLNHGPGRICNLVSWRRIQTKSNLSYVVVLNFAALHCCYLMAKTHQHRRPPSFIHQGHNTPYLRPFRHCHSHPCHFPDPTLYFS